MGSRTPNLERGRCLVGGAGQRYVFRDRRQLARAEVQKAGKLEAEMGSRGGVGIIGVIVIVVVILWLVGVIRI